MGTNFRTRLTGRNSSAPGAALSEHDVETVLGRLAAYDDARPQERRRPTGDVPALRGRAGLWRR
jgi:hypothetical protein